MTTRSFKTNLEVLPLGTVEYITENFFDELFNFSFSSQRDKQGYELFCSSKSLKILQTRRKWNNLGAILEWNKLPVA